MALPVVDFTGKDITEIENSIITTYEGIAERTLAEADPVRLFLLAIASIISQQRVLIDFAAKQNLLAYAEGDFLDQLGDLFGALRIQAEFAITTLRFSLAAIRATPVTIPLGTRATPGNNIAFATTAEATIPAGSLYVDVAARATVAGSAANGFIAGEIDAFIDLVPFVSTVSNTTTSQGGVDKETDTNYRTRIRQAPERFSVAGPRGAYQYWARTASATIIDVSVYSNTPGQVEIRALLTDGEIPSTELCELIEEICSAEDVRPLTDVVNCDPPTQVSYDVAFTYWIALEDLASKPAIQADVETAVDEYLAWQRTKLGRDINPSELIRRVMNAGAKRVDVTSPSFTTLSLEQVASEGTVTITYGGEENA